eukprot:Rhum_TRINITY_DN15251_c0_g1::Rhum_TRINITY_DN15251_c0_g1_i2::g.144786::m.144786
MSKEGNKKKGIKNNNKRLSIQTPQHRRDTTHEWLEGQTPPQPEPTSQRSALRVPLALHDAVRSRRTARRRLVAVAPHRDLDVAACRGRRRRGRRRRPADGCRASAAHAACLVGDVDVPPKVAVLRAHDRRVLRVVRAVEAPPRVRPRSQAAALRRQLQVHARVRDGLDAARPVELQVRRRVQHLDALHVIGRQLERRLLAAADAERKRRHRLRPCRHGGRRLAQNGGVVELLHNAALLHGSCPPRRLVRRRAPHTVRRHWHHPAPPGARCRRAQHKSKVVVAVRVRVVLSLHHKRAQVHHLTHRHRPRQERRGRPGAVLRERHHSVELHVRGRSAPGVRVVVCRHVHLGVDLVVAPVVHPRRPEAVHVAVVQEEERVLRRHVRAHVSADPPVHEVVRNPLEPGVKVPIVRERHDHAGKLRLRREPGRRGPPALQAVHAAGHAPPVLHRRHAVVHAARRVDAAVRSEVGGAQRRALCLNGVVVAAVAQPVPVRQREAAELASQRAQRLLVRQQVPPVPRQEGRRAVRVGARKRVRVHDVVEQLRLLCLQLLHRADVRVALCARQRRPRPPHLLRTLAPAVHVLLLHVDRDRARPARVTLDVVLVVTLCVPPHHRAHRLCRRHRQRVAVRQVLARCLPRKHRDRLSCHTRRRVRCHGRRPIVRVAVRVTEPPACGD